MKNTQGTASETYYYVELFLSLGYFLFLNIKRKMRKTLKRVLLNICQEKNFRKKH